MFIDISRVKVYIRPGFTDMRKSVNGLSALVYNEMSLDPMNGHLFLFTNRRRKILKCLYWDRNGFCLWSKHLEQDSFPWLISNEDAYELTEEQLRWLLTGIDFFHEHKSINYSMSI